jgi:hypothetical protein
MKPSDVADIIKKSLQEAGIEPCDGVDGIIGFSLMDDKDRIKEIFKR